MFLGIAERMNKEIVALAPSAMKIKIIFCFKNLIALFLLVIFFPSFLFISIKIIFQFFIAFMFPPTNNYELTQLQLPSLQLNYPASNSTIQPPTNPPTFITNILLLASSTSYKDWGPRGCSPSRGKE